MRQVRVEQGRGMGIKKRPSGKGLSPLSQTTTLVLRRRARQKIVGDLSRRSTIPRRVPPIKGRG